jgi:hypothetical protein
MFPSCVLPSKNVTVPVGFPDEVVTVAVNVTACPTIDGFAEETTAVLVVAWTVCRTPDDVTGANVASPLYRMKIP